MEQTAKPRKSLQYWMRAVHRVLGYLALGIIMVYAFSGVTLIYRTTDFMKHGTQVTTTLSPGLDSQGLAAALKMKGIKVTDETAEVIVFADGRYDKLTGEVDYVKKDVVVPVNKFIDLHKTAEGKNLPIAIIMTIFGIILFLLALTALFMYKPSAKQFKANMLYLAIGIVITVLLVVLV